MEDEVGGVACGLLLGAVVPQNYPGEKFCVPGTDR